MNKITMTQKILSVAALSLLALAVPTANGLRAQDKPAAAKEKTTLAKNLLGT